MSNPIRLDSELIAAAQRESLVKKRSVPKQIEFWATLGKTLQNVLDYSDIITVLQGMKKITVESVESGTADPKAVFASPDRAVLQRRIQGGWMTRQKQLWFPAGGKGAGRPTFYGLFLEPRGVKLVNADLIAKIINPETPESVSYEAAGMADSLRGRPLQQAISFCFETAFSHPSKIDFVARAKGSGYEVVLVYIHLDSPSLNEAYVHQRISHGDRNENDQKRLRITNI